MTSLALPVFAVFVAAAPPTTEELVKLGESHAGRGDGKKALPHLQKALSQPDLSDALRARAEKALGSSLLQLKKAPEAATHLESAAKLSPQDEKTWLLLGFAHDAAGAPAEAIGAYQRGVAALPKSAGLKHELGMSLLEAGKNDEAAKVLVAAAALAPQDGEVHTDASYALVVTGQYKEAREQAVLAVELSPESPDALFNLGSAEAGLGNDKPARAALARALEVDDMHVPTLVQLGLLEQKAGDDKKAVARFNRVLQIEADNARARAGLGASLARLGSDDATAAKLLAETVHVDPKNVMALALWGDVLERQGQLDDAIKRYEAVAKLRAGDKAVKARLDELKAKRREAKK